MARWVCGNARWLALGMIAIGAAIRVVDAAACYLNPDEAAHFDLAFRGSWNTTLAAALTISHPPLLILVLHAVLFFGRSELALRIPSVIAGVGAMGFTFAWLREKLGAIPALAGLGYMALSPAAISASTEVRDYGLLLFFVCGALYATERAFSTQYARWAILQGLFLAGAVLSGYTAMIVVAALGIYAAIRCVTESVPRHVKAAFAGVQLAIALILALLYFGQVRRLSMLAQRGTDYLAGYYATGGPIRAAWTDMAGTFAWAVGMQKVAQLILLVFAAGVVAAALGRTRAPRVFALLTAAPFVMGFLLSLPKVFPFAGSRHEAYLLPFVAAGIAAFFAGGDERWQAWLLLPAIIFAPIWLMRTAPANDPRSMSIRDMQAAIAYMNNAVQPGPLFVDYETRLTLHYYLARKQVDWRSASYASTIDETVGQYRVISPLKYTWAFQQDRVLEQLREREKSGVIPKDKPVWIVTTDWGDTPLASRLGGAALANAKVFGRISILRIDATQP